MWNDNEIKRIKDICEEGCIQGPRCKDQTEKFQEPTQGSEGDTPIKPKKSYKNIARRKDNKIDKKLRARTTRRYRGTKTSG